jgi:(p)ppGpp synthase/HD superfamily hydrolase
MEPPRDLMDAGPLVADAWRVAANAHVGQQRDSDCVPFVEHPVAVARLLAGAGFSEEVVAAGLLHDTLEKTDLVGADVAVQFGARVSRLVLALTEDDRIEDYAERKAEHRARVARAGRDAGAIFAADKLAKVRELRPVVRADPDGLEARAGQSLERRLGHYRASLAVLERAYPDLPFLEPLAVELRGLEAERRRVPAAR